MLLITFEPFDDAVWVEQVFANSQLAQSFSVCKSVHANYTLFAFELINELVSVLKRDERY